MNAEQNFPSDYRERRAPRLDIETKTRLTQDELYSVEVKIRDVSQCGFMAECPQTVAIGSYVSLDVPGIGSVHAQVRWQIVGRMGGMFLDPISLNRCEWVAVRAGESLAASD